MIDALRQFVLIAEVGTFTGAARRAHLSQPALTAAMQRLELEIGARLFDRGRAGARLTAAGEALLPRARASLAAFEDGKRAVAEIEGLERGHVRIGAGATACTYLLPPVLAAFRRAHPRVSFLLREATTTEVNDALEAGTLDLGVVTDARGEPWFDDELVLVGAPDEMQKQPRRKRKPSTSGNVSAEASNRPFVTFGVGSITRMLLDRHFPNAEIVMELGSIAAIKGNVRAGIGVALVSRHAVKTDVSLHSLVVLPHPATPIRRRLSLVHRGVDRLPPAAAALRRLLLKRARFA